MQNLKRGAAFAVSLALALSCLCQPALALSQSDLLTAASTTTEAAASSADTGDETTGEETAASEAAADSAAADPTPAPAEDAGDETDGEEAAASSEAAADSAAADPTPAPAEDAADEDAGIDAQSYVEDGVTYYTITYVYDAAENVYGTENFAEGEYVEVPSLTGGFMTPFLGWSTNQYATEATYAPGDGFTATEDVTLYPVYTSGDYTALGTATSASYAVSVQAGGYAWFQVTPASTLLYKFYTITEGLDTYGELYDADGNLLASNDDGYGNLRFLVTAVLEAGKTYYFGARMLSSTASGSFDVSMEVGEGGFVQFDANDGGAGTVGNLPTAQAGEQNAGICLSTNNPTREGYRFAGWGTSPDAAAPSYHPGSDYVLTANATLYALWEEADYGFIYRQFSDGHGWISGVTGTLPSELTIPATYNGVTITSILDYTLSGSAITSLTVAEGIESINPYAFCDCSALTTVQLPSTLTYIDGRAFANDSAITSLSVTEGGSYLAKDGFLYNGAAKVVCAPAVSGDVVVPEGVTEIGEYAFYGQSGMTSITLPQSLQTLGYQACSYTGITELEIPAGVSNVYNPCYHSYAGLAKLTVCNPYATFTSVGFSNGSVVIHGYAGSTAQTYAEENGYTFEASLGEEIPEAYAIAAKYAGDTLFTSLNSAYSPVTLKIYNNESDYLESYTTCYAAGVEDGKLVFYQRFLTATNASQNTDLSGELGICINQSYWDSANGVWVESYPCIATATGTLVADPTAQTICDTLGYTGTSYALRYEFAYSEELFNSQIRLQLNGSNYNNGNWYYLAKGGMTGASLTPVTTAIGSYSAVYGAPSTAVDLSDLDRFATVNFNLLLDNGHLVHSSEYDLTYSFTPDEGYDAEDLSVYSSNYTSVSGPYGYNSNRNWSLTVQANGDVAGVLTVIATAVDGSTEYREAIRVASIRGSVEPFATMDNACDYLTTATHVTVANNLEDSAVLYLRGAAGLSADELEPANWTLTDTNGLVTATLTALDDSYAQPTEGRSASALQATLSCTEGVSGQTGTLVFENTVTGACCQLDYTLTAAMEDASFNENPYDGNAFAADRIYATIGSDGRYWTADTATPGFAATTGHVATFGGFGNINMKLGEVINLGNNLLSTLTGKIYDFGTQLFKAVCNVPTWVLQRVPALSSYFTADGCLIQGSEVTDAVSTDGSVVDAAYTYDKENGRYYATLTANKLGTTTVTYDVHDPKFASNVQPAEQTVTVVGDLDSMSLEHLSNATMADAKILMLDPVADSGGYALDAPQFTWVDGIEGLDDYRYYLCGDQSLATLEQRDGQWYLVPKALGVVTLLAESTATRSNVDGCNWERLYADEQGYAEYAVITVVICKDGVYDFGGIGLSDGIAVYHLGRESSLLGGQLYTVSGEEADSSLWEVRWRFPTSTTTYTLTTVDNLTTAVSGPAESNGYVRLYADLYYSGTLLATKSYALTGKVAGDCYGDDGQVTTADLLTAANYIAGKAVSLTPEELLALDTDENGTVDAEDLTRINRYVTGELDPLTD